MFKARHALLLGFAALLAVFSTAITFGAQSRLDHRKGQTITAQTATEQHNRTAPSRHHRLKASTRHSKRLPNAKSLREESW